MLHSNHLPNNNGGGDIDQQYWSAINMMCPDNLAQKEWREAPATNKRLQCHLARR